MVESIKMLADLTVKVFGNKIVDPEVFPMQFDYQARMVKYLYSNGLIDIDKD